MQGRTDLARLSGGTLEGWQRAVYTHGGADFDTVAALADEAGQETTFIEAAAGLQQGADHGDLDVDPNSREARAWIGADGAPTQAVYRRGQ